MQLSKLEAKGFKSFGEKITIHFEDGITGIVGPNGCGKSNVIDAIRWVLGEQKTRSLRSEKMEDVIFNGTKNRKPLQMAEVSITFNNTKNLLPTEYAQVTITRRYYRTGDSEYEINGVSCRLKDITNLFLDTGIGSDSYAIIELKMVEDILNDRDGSRRELFEEAAGVSKFKIRKKQTLKKLEDTEKDLNRVDDLVFEIEKNLKSLEKQAKQTERFYELKESYQSKSIILAKLSLADIFEKIESLKNTEIKESDKKLELNTLILQNEAENERFKLEIVQNEKLLKEAQILLNNQVNKIRNYESEKKIKNERLNYLIENRKRIVSQIENDKNQQDKHQILIKSIGQELNSLTKQQEEHEAYLQKLKNNLDVQKQKTDEIQLKLSEHQNKYKGRQEMAFQLTKAIELSQMQLTTLKQELEKNAQNDSIQLTELGTFDIKIKDLNERIEEKEHQLMLNTKAENENNDKILATETQILGLKDLITEQNRKLDAKQNEFNLTKSLVENLEGFPEAVRFLKKNADWAKEIPLLSDIITCDEKYRVAIENYLEPLMNYFIVETQEQAIKGVNLLSDASMGKAHFFVLSSFKNIEKSTQITNNEVFLAISVVDFSPKYKDLFEFLLKDVYITLADDFDSLDFDRENKAIFIAQNGKIIQRINSVSGGSVGLFEGKRIGRAKNLEFLEKEIKNLQSLIADKKNELNERQAELSVLKEKSVKSKIEIIQTEFNQLKQEHIAYFTKQEQLRLILDRNTDRKEEILEKMDQLEVELRDNKPKFASIQSELSNLDENIQFLKDELAEEQQILQQITNSYNEQNISFYQLKNKTNSLAQDLKHQEENEALVVKRLNQFQLEIQKIDTDTKILEEKAAVNDDELIAFYEVKAKMELELNEIEKKYYAIRAKVDEAEKKNRELVRQKENIDKILQEIAAKTTENTIQLTAIKERLSLEFNINLQDIQTQQVEEVQDEKLLKSEIESLKNAMDRIGQINPMAMEAYKEIKERYDLISQQKADILAAKDLLLTTISEIDTTAKDNFLTAFHQIRENFVEVFRSLFTEDDSCDLILTNPNDPLESPIDIIAKPKGKRPQSINQLSGGEKTLTAISLLFAIYLIKPAPFCIFDEVDAPLDDANIDKFNQIIKKFSKSSQFIIVTHNKRTMASTDVVYGVTMVETGISKVVSVDLREVA